MGYGTAKRCSAVAALVCGGLLVLITSEVAQGQANGGGTPHTVLEGVFTAAQAERGAGVYEEHCAACHDGADVDGPPLTGAPFIDRWREDTLAGLFDFMKTQMPQTAPGSLSEAAYLDVLAHLLYENDFAAGPRELTKDVVATTLLVGPTGPQPLPNGALVQVVGCLSQSPAREWTITRAARPSRVREGKQISAAEAAAAAAAAPGTETFTLQNVGEGGTPRPGSGAAGQKVVVKGALTQRVGGARIHVTTAQAVAGTCA
jgi:S-disulfanyl-L-cysteine oxidoreductase SoxD